MAVWILCSEGLWRKDKSNSLLETRGPPFPVLSLAHALLLHTSPWHAENEIKSVCLGYSRGKESKDKIAKSCSLYLGVVHFSFDCVLSG